MPLPTERTHYCQRQVMSPEELVTDRCYLIVRLAGNLDVTLVKLLRGPYDERGSPCILVQTIDRAGSITVKHFLSDLGVIAYSGGGWNTLTCVLTTEATDLPTSPGRAIDMLSPGERARFERSVRASASPDDVF